MVSGRVVMGSPGQSRPMSNRTGSSGISLMMRGQSPAVVETLTSAAVISRTSPRTQETRRFLVPAGLAKDGGPRQGHSAPRDEEGRDWFAFSLA